MPITDYLDRDFAEELGRKPSGSGQDIKLSPTEAPVGAPRHVESTDKKPRFEAADQAQNRRYEVGQDGEFHREDGSNLACLHRKGGNHGEAHSVTPTDPPPLVDGIKRFAAKDDQLCDVVHGSIIEDSQAVVPRSAVGEPGQTYADFRKSHPSVVGNAESMSDDPMARIRNKTWSSVSSATRDRLRAIARAPAIVQDLYDRKLLTQQDAAKLGPYSSSPEAKERIAAVLYEIGKQVADRSPDDPPHLFRQQLSRLIKDHLGTGPDTADAPDERCGDIMGAISALRDSKIRWVVRASAEVLRNRRRLRDAELER